MPRWYKPLRSTIAGAKEALPGTKQRLQISKIGESWCVNDIHDRVKMAFPDHDADYTVFGTTSYDDTCSVRQHNKEPTGIVEFGVEYAEDHRTYDDIIIDGRDDPVTTHWFDERPKSQSTEDLSSLEDLLQTITISRLGKTTVTGRHMSPYQRDSSK